MTSPGVPFWISFWATSTEMAALPLWLFRYWFRYTIRAIAAMTAAITPSKTVPCRVVNSLLDVMFSTALPPLDFLPGKCRYAHARVVNGAGLAVRGARRDVLDE